MAAPTSLTGVQSWEKRGTNIVSAKRRLRVGEDDAAMRAVPLSNRNISPLGLPITDNAAGGSAALLHVLPESARRCSSTADRVNWTNDSLPKLDRVL